jgi:hypothetical protein
MKIERQIEQLVEIASQIALAEIERIARKVLRKHKSRLTEFVMAMGSATFTHKDGTNVGTNEWESFAGMRPLDKLLDEWDETLHLTGTPMRFTADGPKVTDW